LLKQQVREIEKDKKARMRIKKAEKDTKRKIKHLLRNGMHARDVTDFAKGYSFFFPEREKKSGSALVIYQTVDKAPCYEILGTF